MAAHKSFTLENLQPFGQKIFCSNDKVRVVQIRN